jgi:hypothetical protein
MDRCLIHKVFGVIASAETCCKFGTSWATSTNWSDLQLADYPPILKLANSWTWKLRLRHCCSTQAESNSDTRYRIWRISEMLWILWIHEKRIPAPNYSNINPSDIMALILEQLWISVETGFVTLQDCIRIRLRGISRNLAGLHYEILIIKKSGITWHK